MLKQRLRFLLPLSLLICFSASCGVGTTCRYRALDSYNAGATVCREQVDETECASLGGTFKTNDSCLVEDILSGGPR